MLARETPEKMVAINLEDDTEAQEHSDLTETSPLHYGTFDDDEDDDEETENDSPTRWALLSSLSSAWDSVKSYLPSWHAIKHYLPSYKSFLLTLTSMITSLPLLPFAFGFPTGTAPQFFSQEWFLELSTFYLTASILNTVLFLGIETVIRNDHFSVFMDNLAHIVKNSCKSLADMIAFVANAFFSATAAMAGVGLGYLSYETYPPLAIPSGFLNGGVVLAFRIEFMDSFFTYIKKKFNEDSQFQLVIMHLLERLKVEHSEDFAELFADEEITVESTASFLDAIFTRALEAKESEVLFDTPTALDKVKECLGKGFDAAAATTFGSAFGTFFAVNGYLGLEILCELIASECPLNELDHTHQGMIAVIAGLSSGVLGFMTGLNLRSLAIETYHHLKKHPEDLPKFLALLLGSGVQASSIYVATKDILGRENVFGLGEGLLGTLFVAANTLLIGTFCYKSLFKLLLQREDKNLTVENVIHELASQPLPEETLSSLRQHSFFNPPSNHENESVPAPPRSLTFANATV